MSVLLGLAVGVRAQSSSANPYAPLPYRPLGNVGQALVDLEMFSHPELKLVTLHITPQGVAADSDKDRCILCSSIGRIGKPDEDEDNAVFDSGKATHEVETAMNPKLAPWAVTQAPKYEVSMPLLDRSGEKIGLLVLCFGYRPGDDTAKLDRIADAILNDIRNRISSKDDLLAPASS